MVASAGEFELPTPKEYAVGMVFFPKSLNQYKLCAEIFEEQLKKQLEDLLGEFPGENNGSMEKISEDMDEIIQDFKDQNISRETIERQKRILFVESGKYRI